MSVLSVRGELSVGRLSSKDQVSVLRTRCWMAVLGFISQNNHNLKTIEYGQWGFRVQGCIVIFKTYLINIKTIVAIFIFNNILKE